MQIVLISGLSGSGKSIALNVLEDAAYYVATCTRGGRAISGGFRQDSTYYAWANESAPQNTSEWFYYITNNSSVYDTQIYFVTTCAL